MTRLRMLSILGAIALCSLAFPWRAQAQEATTTPDPAAVARDARRVEDLLRIKKGLDVYEADYWFLPRYNIDSPAMSDDFWRYTTTSKDFRRRMRDYVNQLPVDPWNDPMRGFRYVYGYVPLDDKDAPDCAGKTVLFAARVETDAARYEECVLPGAGKRILYVITSEKKVKTPDLVAGVLAPFLNFFRALF